MSLRIFILSLFSLAVLAGCSNSKLKERKEQRDRVVQSSKMYCEFINGEMFPDMDVALNLEMAKHCDSEKPFSLTNYRTPTDNPGILYCCAISSKAQSTPAPDRNKKKEDKKDPKADEIIE